MAVAVEPMQLRDIPDVLVIEKLSFPIPWSKQAFVSELYNRHAIYLVARDNDMICGYTGMWLIFDEGHITNLAVHPAYRRRGIGRLLLNSRIQTVKKQGLRRFTLEVRRSNLAAQKLYAEFGFIQVGVRPRYYQDDQEDALIMWKELD